MATISSLSATQGISYEQQHAPVAGSSAATRVVPISNKRTAQFTTQSSAQKKLLRQVEQSNLLHMQHLWVSRSRSNPERTTSNAFRMGLQSSWLTLARARPDMPLNAIAHLWTDRRSLKALYMPVAGTGLPDLEIPYSMLDRVPVSLHGPDHLDRLINSISNRDARQLARALVHHETSENICLRKDLLTLVLAATYQASTRRRQLNVQADIDVVKGTHAMGVRNGGSQQEPIDDEVPLNLDERDAIEAELLAPFPQATEDRLKAWSKAPDRGIGVVPPQRERTIADTYPTQRRPDAEENLARSMDALMQRGFANLKMANDVIASTPHHPRTWAVAFKTAHVLRTGQWQFDGDPASMAHRQYMAGVAPQPAPMSAEMFEMLQEFAGEVQDLAATLHSMTHDAAITDPEAMTQRQRIDMFMLAERIRQAEPLLQDKVDVLRVTADNPRASPQEKEEALARIAAISGVYDWVGSFIEFFVNLHTYMPQVEYSAAPLDDEVRELFRNTLGASPVAMQGDSWKSNKLRVPEGTDERDFDLMEHRQMFREIVDMLRQQPARTTNDIVDMAV
ncbi:hypothetical protein PMI40_03619 [Herbaspirillum sp. YR522]|nr:hypothetical protein PMI40_03619 [Herbaspirillum sp. YR522]